MASPCAIQPAGTNLSASSDNGVGKSDNGIGKNDRKQMAPDQKNPRTCDMEQQFEQLQKEIKKIEAVINESQG
jgi:hypothetical protein